MEEDSSKEFIKLPVEERCVHKVRLTSLLFDQVWSCQRFYLGSLELLQCFLIWAPILF